MGDEGEGKKRMMRDEEKKLLRRDYEERQM